MRIRVTNNGRDIKCGWVDAPSYLRFSILLLLLLVYLPTTRLMAQDTAG